MRRSVVIADKWAPYAIKKVEDTILKAHSLIFLPIMEDNDRKQLFGHLTAVRRSGETVNIGQELIKERRAELSTDFLSGIFYCPASRTHNHACVSKW